MKRAIELLKYPRLMVLENIKDLAIEQVNKVPEGFKNNIAWNLGHMVAAQEGICYKRAGLETNITDEFLMPTGQVQSLKRILLQKNLS